MVVITPIFTAVAIMILSSNSVISRSGNFQFSLLSGSSLTHGLTPPLAVLLGNSLACGDISCSSLVKYIASRLQHSFVDNNCHFHVR